MSQAEGDHVVTVFSDYVCPFCYLGRASLRSYLEATDDPPAVEWHPFDLRGQKRGPDGTIREDVDDGKDEDYYERARENVRRLADQYGVEMVVDRDRDVDSFRAQQLALAVQTEYDRETFAALDDAIFDAHWRGERDVGDPDVLVELAGEAGIPEDDARAILEDDEREAALRDRFDAARQHGVTGVPTFVYDGYAARGAVPPEQLRQLIQG